MALRLVLRIREDGRVTEDLVRSEEDFRELIESSSDGIAIMDDDFRLLFTSPAARSLLGLDGATDDTEVSLLDLVDPDDRELVRSTATLACPPARAPPLHFRVARRTTATPASSRPPPPSGPAAAAACSTCATSPSAAAASASSSAWPTPTT